MAGAALLVATLAAGCAAHDPPPTIRAIDPSGVPLELAEAESVTVPAEDPGLSAQDAEQPAVVEGLPEDPSLRELCRLAESDDLIEESRRVLAETFCGATLWFDSLFGGSPDLYSARAVSGWVELSTIHTEFDGLDFNGRLRLNYDLPNLERRLRFFLGRAGDQEFITDRQEGFAIRSSVFGLEGEERWLTGLGYRPPGRFERRLDFRIGARVRTSPEVFTQVRHRHNRFVGEYSVWRFRETIFWENRDGFGVTASADWDRVLRPDALLRVSNIGTVSEATRGIDWRSAALLYHNLRSARAVAGELFARGDTGAPVDLHEYGFRGIYRQPLGRPYLFGELVAGYTWPREEPHQKRDGSFMLGFGIELLFGTEP